MKTAPALLSVAAAALLGLASAGTLLGGTRAASATALDYDFEVTVATGIPAPRPGLPACSDPDAGGVRTCAIAGNIPSAELVNLTGTVRQASTGRSGRLNAICRWSGDFRATARISSSFAVELTALSGTAKQACSWFVSLPGAGNITGTMSGGGSLGLAGPATGTYDGTLAVFVGGGAGEFAGVAGNGSFSHRQDFAVPLGASLRSLATARAEPSRLKLSLHAGKPAALVAAPIARLSAQTDSGLRVVSVPGSTCTATARKGTRTVRLGPARDGNNDGLVVVVAKLRPKLAPGRWTIAASCAYRSGGKTGTALARAVVTVS